jgi:hypothetical protein
MDTWLDFYSFFYLKTMKSKSHVYFNYWTTKFFIVAIYLYRCVSVYVNLQGSVYVGVPFKYLCMCISSKVWYLWHSLIGYWLLGNSVQNFMSKSAILWHISWSINSKAVHFYDKNGSEYLNILIHPNKLKYRLKKLKFRQIQSCVNS